MPAAAYCSACRQFVFVTAEGACEHGHHRPNLRGIHEATVDRRTGRPKPPSARDLLRGPSDGAQQGFFGNRVTPAVAAAPPVAPRAVAEAPCAEAPPRDGAFARLFGEPRGRHSKGSSGNVRRTAIGLLAIAILAVALADGYLVATSSPILPADLPALLALAP
ncbi:MAG: hypothetical protein HY876_01080 [Coriobacteriales bacterium]|nr:hypothetical protein [Coriobacteriales bacterium]